jgi:hypothetical protein
MKISPFGNTDEIEIPTVADFKAKVAEEFLRIHGPRRFLSFVQRCQLSGPWRETIKIKKKIGRVTKSVSYSKFEHELSNLLRRKKKFESLKKSITETEAKRIDDLQNLVSDELSNKSDEEMKKLSLEIIEKLRK